MKNQLLILILFFLFSDCSNNPKQVEQPKISKSATIAPESKKVPKVEVSYFKTSRGILLGFQPRHLKVNFTTNRPFESDNIYFSVAGAFTSKEKSVDGLAIENGNKKNTSLNKFLNGFVEIENGKIVFHKFNDSLIEEISKKVISSKGSLFQQQLLITDSKINECKLFGNKINTRRALAEIKGMDFVIQSIENITIKDFQIALQEISVSNAIYLDMGSWSEGWFIDSYNKKQSLGDNFANTQNQKSWIIFQK